MLSGKGMKLLHHCKLLIFCRNFQKPVAVKMPTKDSTSEGPAPNEYYPLNAIISRNRIVTGEACFKSGSTRVVPIASNSLDPGPGYYSPKYSLTHNSPRDHRSCFAPASKKGIQLEQPTQDGPGKLHCNTG